MHRLISAHVRLQLATIMLGLTAPHARAGPPVLYVDDDAPPGGNGATWATAFSTLQAALAAVGGVSPPVEIRMAGGTYYTSTQPVGPFVLVSDTSVRGGFRGPGLGGDPNFRDPEQFPTVLDGDPPGGSFRSTVLTGRSLSACVLDGLVIQNGAPAKGSGFGAGGIALYDSAVALTQCTLRGNRVKSFGSTDAAGAIHAEACVLDITGCIIDGNNLGPGRGAGAMRLSESTVRITQSQITSNHAGNDAVPGGIMAINTTLLVEATVLNDHVGHALEAHGGRVTILNSEVAGNFGDASSALRLACPADLIGLTIEHNIGFTGGAIVSSGSLRMRDCRVADNTAAVAQASGVECSGPLEVTGCAFEGNGSGQGWKDAALRATGEAAIANCEFRGNHALTAAISLGGPSRKRVEQCVIAGNRGLQIVTVSGAPVSIRQCTVAHNDSHGGGCLWLGNGATAAVENCIFWGNRDTTLKGVAAHLSTTLFPVSVAYSCVESWSPAIGGLGLTGDSPAFVSALDGDYHLSPGSAAIDSASNSGTPPGFASDIEGRARFVDDAGTSNSGLGSPPADMGAYEFSGAPCYADCNGDGALTVADFGCFQSKFIAGCP